MNNRNKQIETIRILSCLIIFIFHVTYFYINYVCTKSLPVNVDFFVSFSVVGVQMFMIISLFFSYSRNSKNALKKFFKKVVRLYIPFVIAVIFVFIILSIWKLPGRETNSIELLANFTMFPTLFGFKNIEGSHWYLSTIVILCFIISISQRLKITDAVFTIWVLIALILGINGKGNYLLQYRYCGLAVFVFELRKLIEKEYKYIWFDILLILICIIQIISSNGFSYFVVLVINISIFLLAYFKKLTFLELKITNLSKYTYSFYLIHNNLSYLIINHFVDIYGDYRLLYIFVAFFVVSIFSVLLYLISSNLETKILTSKPFAKIINNS